MGFLQDWFSRSLQKKAPTEEQRAKDFDNMLEIHTARMEDQ
jgi:hypothetical protein